jgi:hypothetical protein
MKDLGVEEKAADAQTAFVIAAWRALPLKARRQLFSRRAEKEAHWAKRWRVDAPCLVEYAKELRAFDAACRPAARSRAKEPPLGTGAVGCEPWLMESDVDRRISVPPPPQWLSERKRLDKLPHSLRVSLSDKVTASYLDEYRGGPIADDEEMLAPVAADPLQETKDHFMSRAEDHFRARQLRLRRIAKDAGFTSNPPAQTPELAKHVGWLVRFQINDESASAIARSSGLHGPDQRVTVAKAIRQLARLIGLPLRPVARGRPRCRRAASAGT